MAVGRNCRTVKKAVRKGREWQESCEGNSREGGSDGSGTIGRSGPTWRYDTWPGPANCGSVGVDPLPRLWRWMGGVVRCGGMARWNGVFESSRNGPFKHLIFAEAKDGVQRKGVMG